MLYDSDQPLVFVSWLVFWTMSVSVSELGVLRFFFDLSSLSNPTEAIAKQSVFIDLRPREPWSIDEHRIKQGFRPIGDQLVRVVSWHSLR